MIDGVDLLGELVEASLIIFGPLIPYFFGGIVAGSLVGALVSFGIDVGRVPRTPPGASF